VNLDPARRSALRAATSGVVVLRLVA